MNRLFLCQAISVIWKKKCTDIAINLTLSSVLDICISLFDMSYVRSRNGEMAGVKCKEYKS